MQRAEKNAVLWFAEINGRGLFRELGYSSIHQYAAEALGFSQSRTYQFLRLAESVSGQNLDGLYSHWILSKQ